MYEQEMQGASDCTFTVAGGTPRPTTTAIVVENDHACEYWDFAVAGANRYTIAVLGDEYDIVGYGEDGTPCPYGTTQHQGSP